MTCLFSNLYLIHNLSHWSLYTITIHYNIFPFFILICCPGSKCSNVKFFLWCPLCFIAFRFSPKKWKPQLHNYIAKPQYTDGQCVKTSLKGHLFSHLALMTWGCLHHHFTTSHRNLLPHTVLLLLLIVYSHLYFVFFIQFSKQASYFYTSSPR